MLSLAESRLIKARLFQLLTRIPTKGWLFRNIPLLRALGYPDGSQFRMTSGGIFVPELDSTTGANLKICVAMIVSRRLAKVRESANRAKVS